MIDLHCHILPGLDDGAPDLATSVEMARMAAAEGITKIVATPHVRQDYPFDTAEISPRTRELNDELRRAGVPIEVVPGGEVGVTRALDLEDDELREACLGSTSYLLVESPYTPAPDTFENNIFDLQIRGFQLVLAHPERSPSFISDPDRLARLVERGVLCSITAAALDGRFGKRVVEVAFELMRRGLVHDIASDAHDPRARRPGLLRGLRAIEERLPAAAPHARWLVEDAPGAILAGETLPPAPDWGGTERSTPLRRLRALLRG